MAYALIYKAKNLIEKLNTLEDLIELEALNYLIKDSMLHITYRRKVNYHVSGLKELDALVEEFNALSDSVLLPKLQELKTQYPHDKTIKRFLKEYIPDEEPFYTPEEFKEFRATLKVPEQIKEHNRIKLRYTYVTEQLYLLYGNSVDKIKLNLDLFNQRSADCFYARGHNEAFLVCNFEDDYLTAHEILRLVHELGHHYFHEKQSTKPDCVEHHAVALEYIFALNQAEPIQTELLTTLHNKYIYFIVGSYNNPDPYFYRYLLAHYVARQKYNLENYWSVSKIKQ